MLSRLQAEERLAAITDGAVAGGTMEPREQRDVLGSLKKQAAIALERPVKANAAVLADMGIGMRSLSGPSEEGLRGSVVTNG